MRPIALLRCLLLLLLPSCSAQVLSQQSSQRYPTIVPDSTVTRTLAADETVTYVYRDDRQPGDLGAERYMLVEVRGPVLAPAEGCCFFITWSVCGWLAWMAGLAGWLGCGPIFRRILRVKC